LQWINFLDESSSDDVRFELRDHLATCDACQAALDRLSEPAEATLSCSDSCLQSADRPAIDLSPRLEARLRQIVHTTPRAARIEPAAALHEGDRLGDFIIQSEIGRGGMGVVYRAWDTTLSRDVAIKLIHRLGGDAVRFAREATAAARVRHDHIVPVLTAGVAPSGDAFIVMPLIDGLTLRQLIDRDKILRPRQAVEYAKQIAGALGAVHAAGLVHRDVKPGNVLIDQADGRAKLTDFGLAREDDHAAHSTILAGTPEYLSPEQVKSPATLDARTDVYALGVTLYESVTGTTPFRGPPHHVLHRIVTEDPPPPRSVNPEIAADIETIILTALDPDASRRYATANAFAMDLARWLAGQPIHARPTGAIERGWKWARRHPWPTAAATCAVALVAALAAAVVVERQSNARIARINNDLADKVTELDRANQQLAFAQEAAEKAFRISRTGVNRTTKNMTVRLADIPKSEPLVLELLQATSDTYRQLAELRPKDTEMAAVYAEALQEFTNALTKSGSLDAAGPELDRLEAELERQRSQNPADPNLLINQLDLLKSRERLLRRSNQTADLAAVTANFNAELDRLALERPDDPRILRLQFERFAEQMVTAGRRGDGPAALDACRKSVEIGVRWRAAAPRDQTAARQLALQLGFLSMVSYDSKQFDEALDAADRLDQICNDPVHPDGRSLEYRRGIVWLIRGLVARESGDLDTAAQHLATAESIYRRADANFPREYNLRSQLAMVLNKSGAVAAERLLPAEAKRLFAESQSILQRLIAEYPSDSVLPEQLSAVEAELRRLDK
jgi:hypothetical protein